MTRRRVFRSFWTQLVLLSLFLIPLTAQERPRTNKGPVIKEFGPVFPVPDPDLETPLDEKLKAVFDVAQSPEDKSRVNARIETLARFLNMHGQAGVPVENLSVALVLHGSAGKDALQSAAYERRYGVPNPNAPLLDVLRQAGVRVFLCGQTAASRGFEKQELHPAVGMAPSAMTALVKLQNDGFRLIAF